MRSCFLHCFVLSWTRPLWVTLGWAGLSWVGLGCVVMVWAGTGWMVMGRVGLCMIMCLSYLQSSLDLQLRIGEKCLASSPPATVFIWNLWARLFGRKCWWSRKSHTGHVLRRQTGERASRRGLPTQACIQPAWVRRASSILYCESLKVTQAGSFLSIYVTRITGKYQEMEKIALFKEFDITEKSVMTTVMNSPLHVYIDCERCLLVSRRRWREARYVR